MNASFSNTDDQPTRSKVSVTARLAAALVYSIPPIGAALGSLLLVNMFRLLRASENAGLSSVMQGMKEASLPVIVSLYLAAVCGFGLIILLVVRMIIQTKTTSPPFWFFVVSGILSLVPALFFWRAQWLILEVLSPGNTIGHAGIGGVGAEISSLLLIGIVSAVVVLFVLLATSVITFSTRRGRKWASLVVAVFVEIILIAAAVGVPFVLDGPKRKNEIVQLPANVKSAEGDYGVEKETSLVLTLGPDNKLYQRQNSDAAGNAARTETNITLQDVPAKIQRAMEDKTPDNRVVYFKCDVNAAYENVLRVFDAIRKADVDKVKLVVIGEKTVEDKYQISPLDFEVRLPGMPDNTRSVRPNPLMLVAALDQGGKLKLNNEALGTVSDPQGLKDRLADVFKQRENNGVFREGTNEVEKTVFLKVSGSPKYGDFIKLVDAVKTAGAEPIGIQIDDVDTRSSLDLEFRE
jgi:biopolymer transport protein ExbD